MNKRKATSVLSDQSYGVIETVKGRGDVYVELLPSAWLKSVKKNQQIQIRESAKYFYPRPLIGQTHEEYLKYVRRAKFECLQPTNNKKWELLDCKVLKIGIGNRCTNLMVTTLFLKKNIFITKFRILRRGGQC